MAITVTLTSTQAALMSMTVLVLNGAAASPEGAWAASITAPEAAVTPLATGSLVVGCAALHYPADPPGFLSPDAGTVFDLDSQSIRNEALAWHASAAAVAGVPVTTGAPNSGLLDDRAAVALEVLPASGGPVTIDASSPPPLPGPAVQNSALSTGGTITTRTSASFTPPPGAVLAVLGTNNFGPGSTLIASESSGTYTWVRDAAATGNTDVAMALLGIPPAPPPSGTGRGHGHAVGGRVRREAVQRHRHGGGHPGLPGLGLQTGRRHRHRHGDPERGRDRRRCHAADRVR